MKIHKKTIVRIPWTKENDTTYYWNEVCIWAIEYFGLPGERFLTSSNLDFMDFIFDNENDALIMALQWNAKILIRE